MNNEKKLYALVIGACVLSIVLGVAFGYLIFGGATVNASIYAGSQVQGEPFTVPLISGKASEVMDIAQETAGFLPSDNEAHRYIVTVLDGYITVFYADHIGGGVKEKTTSPADVLPSTDIQRLQEGIRIYTEEALARILQDYGS